MRKHIDIVFDGPPSHESGRFVEVEDDRGHSISLGEWHDRGDGLWALRIPQPSPVLAEVVAERDRQDAKWGGPEHDDTHHAFEFFGFISERCALSSLHVRRRLVEIAALAVAALESHDRKEKRGG